MTISIVILSYNVKNLLRQAIESVYSTYPKKDLQVVIVDNASTDGSVAMVKKEFSDANIIESKVNLGFAAGNNLARKIVNGDVLLFLNPDTIVNGKVIENCSKVLALDSKLGAITCRVMLPNGKIDYSCHRGLPTVWNTFCYWVGLSKVFPQSKLFSGYTASFLDINKSHEIDCISGTFLMIKRNVLNKINWWDEDYFWNGDDIELCYNLKKVGYKIWYEPSETIIHYKGSSSGLQSTAKVGVPEDTKLKFAKSAASAMRIFVDKHGSELGPLPLMIFVKLGISMLEKYRLWKIERGMKYE